MHQSHKHRREKKKIGSQEWQNESLSTNQINQHDQYKYINTLHNCKLWKPGVLETPKLVVISVHLEKRTMCGGEFGGEGEGEKVGEGT